MNDNENIRSSNRLYTRLRSYYREKQLEISLCSVRCGLLETTGDYRMQRTSMFKTDT